MKKSIFVLMGIFALVSCKNEQGVTTKNGDGSSTELTNQQDSLSYALGLSIGKNLNDQGFEELNSSTFMQGMEESKDDSARMDFMSAETYIRTYMTELRAQQEEKLKADGIAFLAENAEAEGVVTTDSGLQYKVLREGDGASPDENDRVTVDYEGQLLDGTIFDSSYKKGQPATFNLNGVIRGWTEGLQTMKVGGKTEFYIPYDLGYGTRPGPGGTIPPFSTLIFQVELLDVQPVE